MVGSWPGWAARCLGGILRPAVGDRKPTTGDDLSELRGRPPATRRDRPYRRLSGDVKSARGCEAIVKVKTFSTSATTAEVVAAVAPVGAALAKAKMVGGHPMSYTVFVDRC